MHVLSYNTVALKNSIIRRCCVYRSLIAQCFSCCPCILNALIPLEAGSWLWNRLAISWEEWWNIAWSRQYVLPFPTLIALTLINATLNEDSLIVGSSVCMCVCSIARGLRSQCTLYSTLLLMPVFKSVDRSSFRLLSISVESRLMLKLKLITARISHRGVSSWSQAS